MWKDELKVKLHQYWIWKNKKKVDYASHNVDKCENCQEVMESIINAKEPE